MTSRDCYRMAVTARDWQSTVETVRGRLLLLETDSDLSRMVDTARD